MRRYRTTDQRRSSIFDDIRFDSEDLRGFITRTLDAKP